ncbi:tail protein X [Klebsiella pneumoniae]|nr:tail protein X [Klebsiella pneumoniae]MEA3581460.1 tail protein X [Klebsiella pneumoniae]MEA5591157.1 tail protein X [Klebsiella pneumoniae]
MKVRAYQGDTVDALCWRHYGRTQGVTEQVLQANPGLAEQARSYHTGCRWICRILQPLPRCRPSSYGTEI